MKEVIQKLQALTDTEKEGQDESNNNFANLSAGFMAGMNAIQNAIISSAAASDAQRLSLAMRGEKLAATQASRLAIADKEARQEAADLQSEAAAARSERFKGTTGIDLSQFMGEPGSFTARVGETLLKLFAWWEGATFIFGKKLKKAAERWRGKVGGVVRGLVKKMFQTPYDFIRNTWAWVQLTFEDLIKRGKKLILNIGKGFSNFFGKFAKGGIFTKVFGFFSRFGAVFSRLLPLLGAVGSKIPYVAQAIALIAGIFEAFKRFQSEDGNLLEKIIAGISGFFEGVVGFMIGGILDLGKDLLVWILGIFGVPEEKLQGLKDFSFTDFLKDLVRNMFDAIVGLFKSMFNGAVDGFNNTEGNIFQKILGGIMGYINGWLNGLLDGWAKIIDNIAGHFGFEGFSFKDWLGFTGDEIFDAIVGYFKNIWEKGKKDAMVLIGKAINIGKWIVGFAKNIWDGIVGVFSNIWKKTPEPMKKVIMAYVNIGKWIVGFAKNIWDGIVGVFSIIWEKGKKGAMVLIRKAINIGNWIFRFAKNIWDKLVGVFKLGWAAAKKGAMAVIMAYVNIGKWIFGVAKTLWDAITGLFKVALEKTGALLAPAVTKIINIGGWILGVAKTLWDSFTGIFDSIMEKSEQFAEDPIGTLLSIREWMFGVVKTLWDRITGLFDSIIEKAVQFANDPMGTLLSIGDAILDFVASMLPDRDSWWGGLLAKTGIYEKLGVGDSSASDDGFVDNSAIIPPNSNVGEALTQAGNMTNATSVTVVNNNGGNTTNTTTSSQTNNTSSASPPVLSGSAMAM